MIEEIIKRLSNTTPGAMTLAITQADDDFIAHAKGDIEHLLERVMYLMDKIDYLEKELEKYPQEVRR